MRGIRGQRRKQISEIGLWLGMSIAVFLAIENLLLLSILQASLQQLGDTASTFSQTPSRTPSDAFAEILFRAASAIGFTIGKSGLIALTAILIGLQWMIFVVTVFFVRRFFVSRS